MLHVLKIVVMRFLSGLRRLKNGLTKPKTVVVKSTHRTEIVSVVLEKHPNADSLSIVRVGGYQLCVRTADWLGIDKGAYIQPDSIVPDSMEYAFLGSAIKDSSGTIIGREPLRPKDRRITAKKFRGERSEGLLMPAPRFGSKIGDNVADAMGITRYVSPADLREQEQEARQLTLWDRINRRGRRGLQFSGNERGPSIWVPVYDLENWYYYPAVFTADEPVIITEKIHGCNFRAVYSSLDKRMFVGSRTTWKTPYILTYEPGFLNAILYGIKWKKPVKKAVSDNWNNTARQYPGIELFCKANPDHILFGEVYGDGIQDLKYGHAGGNTSFAAFDVFHRGFYWNCWNVTGLAAYGIPVVPILYDGPYSEEAVRRHIDGKTTVGGDKKQIREGCVIESTMGRKILKAVSSDYLERSS